VAAQGPTHEDELLAALSTVGQKPAPKKLENIDVPDPSPGETTSHDESPTKETKLPAVPKRVTLDNIWRHPDAHPLVLDMLLLQKYGPEWLTWEPETLQVGIPDSFKTASVSDLNLSKVQALKVLHLVDSYWERWEVFLPCTMAFNNEFPDFDVMQVPTVAQVLVSCDIAGRIRDDTAWSSEMKAYIAVVYEHDGIFLPLPPADFVTVPAEGIDTEELRKRWPAVRAAGTPPTGPSLVDEQLRRLTIANGYLEESRARLNLQLPLLANA
jgi:hypothetical protein